MNSIVNSMVLIVAVYGPGTLSNNNHSNTNGIPKYKKTGCSMMYLVLCMMAWVVALPNMNRVVVGLVYRVRLSR